MVRCLNSVCTARAAYRVKEGKKPAYCKQHAKDGMVNVQHKCCSRDACTKRPFNFDTSKTATYSKQHAEDHMVDVRGKRCSYDTCAIKPSFNFFDNKTAVYCKQQAENGMIHVISKRCSRGTCTLKPSLNVKGSNTALYCRQHAADGMVNVATKRCLHDTCENFNIKDSKAKAYCKEHAKDGMVGAHKRRCAHGNCSVRLSFNPTGGRRQCTARNMLRTAWSASAPNVAHTTSARSKCRGVCWRTVQQLCVLTIRLTSWMVPLVCFRQRCKVPGCGNQSTWGLSGRQPSHCRDHGPLEDSLVLTVRTNRAKRVFCELSSGTPGSPPFRVKAEFDF